MSLSDQVAQLALTFVTSSTYIAAAAMLASDLRSSACTALDQPCKQPAAPVSSPCFNEHQFLLVAGHLLST